MPRAATAKKATATKAAPSTEVEQEPLPTDDELESWFADVEETVDYVNSLFYGKEGSGKTTALCRMANMGRTLVINAEGGIKISPLRKRGVDTANLKIWPDPKKPIPLNHKNLDKLYRKIKADLMKDPNSWFCIGFDSITEVYQTLLDDVQGKRVQTLKNKGAEPDEFHVDIADYGTMSKMVRDLLRKFRDLPCHVVFTALERRDIDKDTGKPMYGPAITPGLSADLMGYPDLVLMFKSADEDGPHRALTRANSRYRAKDRFDALPRVMAEPMGDRIIQYVAGELTEDTDPFQDDLPSAAKKAQDRNRPKAEDEDDSDVDDSTDE